MTQTQQAKLLFNYKNLKSFTGTFQKNDSLKQETSILAISH